MCFGTKPLSIVMHIKSTERVMLIRLLVLRMTKPVFILLHTSNYQLTYTSPASFCSFVCCFEQVFRFSARFFLLP